MGCALLSAIKNVTVLTYDTKHTYILIDGMCVALSNKECDGAHIRHQRLLAIITRSLSLTVCMQVLIQVCMSIIFPFVRAGS